MAGILVAVSAFFLGRIESIAHEWPRFSIWFAVAAGGYVLAFVSVAGTHAARREDRGTVLWVLLIALLGRVSLLDFPVSDDVARYLWEGKLQLLGESPYVVPPAAALRLVPGASEDPYCSRVNHPELTTIYPPLCELVYRGVALVAYHPRAWKWTVLGFEAALALVLTRMLARRGESPARLLLYLWHPTVLVSFAGEAHNDVVLLATSWLALHFLEQASRNRSRWRFAAAGAAFAASILAKWASAVWWPLFVRRGFTSIAVGAVATSLLLLLPFRESGPELFTTFLHFGAEMRHNGSIAALLRAWAGPEAGVRLAVLGLLIGWGLVLWQRPAPIVGACLLTTGALLFAPTVHPWYATWFAPFLIFVGPKGGASFDSRIPFRPATLGLVYWSLSLALGWSAYAEEAGSGVFRLPLSTRLWIHGPLVLFALAEATRAFLRAGREDPAGRAGSAGRAEGGDPETPCPRD